MSEAKRKPKAKFRVGQVVIVTTEDMPYKIWKRYFDGLEGQIVYENKYGDERFESQLRPLTARERGGK